MSAKPDYGHIHNLIMAAVQNCAKNRDAETMAIEYGELVDFLETMYINTVLGLAGSMLAVAKHSSVDTKDTLLAVRELLGAPKELMQDKLMSGYAEMITVMNLPDAFQEQTHNEAVADAIKKELDNPTETT